MRFGSAPAPNAEKPTILIIPNARIAAIIILNIRTEEITKWWKTADKTEKNCGYCGAVYTVNPAALVLIMIIKQTINRDVEIQYR